jgi:SAM-dependent methyltransferase
MTEEVADAQGHLARGDIEAALAGLHAAYESARNNSEWSAAAFAANWIGHIHEHHRHDLTAALTWFGRAEESARRSSGRLPQTVATATFNAGLVEEQRGRSTAAARLYSRAAAAAAEGDDPATEAMGRHRRADVLVDLGRLLDGRQQYRVGEILARTAGTGDLVRAGRDGQQQVTARLAQDPDVQFDQLARAGLQRCVATVDHSCPKTILDAGCGWGIGLVALAERWPQARLTGVDRPEVVEAVRLPRAIAPMVTLRPADLAGSDLGPGGFDIVLCHAVLHHLPDAHQTLAALNAVLRPDGQLVGACFVDSYYQHIWAQLEEAGADPPRPDIRHRRADIEDALAAGGWTDTEIWVEEVELQVDEPHEVAYLERVLRRPLAPGEHQRLMAAIDRPLSFDLHPLSFFARRA